MEKVNQYLNHLNEDFSFVNKVFKANVISKISKGVTGSINGKRVNKDALFKALKPIPVLENEKIDKFLNKYLPNFNHNKMVAKKYFDKKHPSKQHNDTVATSAGMIASANDKKSIQDAIKDVDRVYSYAGSSGGGGVFVLMMIGLFVSSGALSMMDEFEFKQRAMVFALGGLLIIASFKSLIS